MAEHLRLLAGLPGSGKTKKLLKTYRSFLRDWQANPTAASGLWIAPSRHRVELVRSAMSDASDVALLEPNILTFAGFAEWVIAHGQQRIRPISPLQKRRLLQRACQEALQARKLSHVAAVVHTPGFLDQLDQQIADLKRRDIWPESFSQQIRGGREQDGTADSAG